jgi:hypothetical protein
VEGVVDAAQDGREELVNRVDQVSDGCSDGHDGFGLN